MQQRWQNSVAKQHLAGTAGEASSEPFAISFCTLGPVRSVSGLLDARPCIFQEEESWVSETFVCEIELHLRGKRFGVSFISHIHIRYKTKNALLFFSFELLDSNLLRGIAHRDCPLHSRNTELDFG